MLSMKFQTQQTELIDASIKYYKEAIDNGIAKEQARCFLPEGLMLSKLYMNGNLRSWIHYVQLRTGNGTQKEHMEIAKQCSKVISKIFPLISKFVKNK